MTDSTLLYKLPELDSNPIVDDLAGWVAVEGKPKATMKTWIQHTSADDSIISGVWQATPGFWHTAYAAYEFASPSEICQLLVSYVYEPDDILVIVHSIESHDKNK
jgi:uncharacterized cupin superfamily protein